MIIATKNVVIAASLPWPAAFPGAVKKKYLLTSSGTTGRDLAKFSGHVDTRRRSVCGACASEITRIDELQTRPRARGPCDHAGLR
jgi:hypothetical protein